MCSDFNLKVQHRSGSINKGECFVLSLFFVFYRMLKKLLRKRTSELDSKQEEELTNRMHRHEKDHQLGPFVGLSPEYMEMSKFKHECYFNLK